MIEYTQARNVTVIGAIVNIGLMILKIWGGIVSGSQALVADGIHSLSDLASDGVVLMGVKWGREGEDENHQFGHGRIETLSSLIVGLMLIGAGMGMLYAAGDTLVLGRTPNPTATGLLIAFLSIFSKELLYQYTKRIGQKINSLALISNAWHHRTDALSSVAVVFGIAAGMINPDWRFLDAIAAIVVAALVVKVGYEFVAAGVKELVDTAPDGSVINRIEDCACSVERVKGVHKIRARTSGGNIFVEIHIIVDGELQVREGHDVAKEVESCLIAQVPTLSKAVVHVDPD